MAMGEITVSVEVAVNNAMRDVVQAIWDQHGIIVRNVSIDWIDLSTAEKRDNRIKTVEMETVFPCF